MLPHAYLLFGISLPEPPPLHVLFLCIIFTLFLYLFSILFFLCFSLAQRSLGICLPGIKAFRGRPWRLIWTPAPNNWAFWDLLRFSPRTSPSYPLWSPCKQYMCLGSIPQKDIPLDSLLLSLTCSNKIELFCCNLQQWTQARCCTCGSSLTGCPNLCVSSTKGSAYLFHAAEARWLCCSRGEGGMMVSGVSECPRAHAVSTLICSKPLLLISRGLRTNRTNSDVMFYHKVAWCRCTGWLSLNMSSHVFRIKALLGICPEYVFHLVVGTKSSQMRKYIQTLP